MYFCKELVGYNLSPLMKCQMVQNIKEKFLYSPTICSIGDGYNDTLMMQ
jgi:magnesium-transporting ATPase (P-type)